jgi:hypothetical protein
VAIQSGNGQRGGRSDAVSHEAAQRADGTARGPERRRVRHRRHGPERVAATVYGACLLLTLTLLLILWRYSVRERLVRPDAGDEEVQLLTRRLTPGLFAYVALIVVGLWVPVVAVGGYLAIALYYIFPFKHSYIIALPRRRQRRPQA